MSYGTGYRAVVRPARGDPPATLLGDNSRRGQGSVARASCQMCFAGAVKHCRSRSFCVLFGVHGCWRHLAVDRVPQNKSILYTYVGAPDHLLIIGEIRLGLPCMQGEQKICNYFHMQCLLAQSLFFFPAPGPPVRLVFPEVRLTSVRIVWQPPEEPNGIILGKREQQTRGWEERAGDQSKHRLLGFPSTWMSD